LKNFRQGGVAAPGVWAVFGCVTVLSGCAVPLPQAAVPLATPATWSVAVDDAATLPLAQDAWWRQLNDHAINVLVPAALTDHPALSQAQARVDEAGASLAMRQADKTPSLQADLGASRARVSDNGERSYATGASLGFALNWEVDLFGRVRSAADGAMYRRNARVMDLEATRLSLAAHVADTVLALRSCRYSDSVVSAEILSRQVTLDMTSRKLAAGAVAMADEARARAGLAAAQTTLALRRQECSGDLNALMALSGLDAAQVEKVLEDKVPSPASTSGYPAEWPIQATPKFRLDLPAAVLSRHPAVLAAEAELAAARADIATADAERLPRLDLGAFFSGQWLRAGAGSDRSWNIGPSLTLPLFDGGRGAAAVSSSQARYRLALAVLRGTVRDAARDVENALAGTLSAHTRLTTTREAADAAQIAFDSTEAMWRAGAASQFVLEDTRRQLALAKNDAITALRDSSQAWVALVLACGNSSIIFESAADETI
jgi:NodT family efflux transporter outer membrane factor (OMF) lipoprotein